MSYLVLARKYRPQTFAEVVGQEHVTRTLGNAFAAQRVHHAFLFCGPRGVGKTTLARILGKSVNCERGPTAEPCGVCDACTSIVQGSAVDYLEMDGASNRGIDAIRELTEAVRYQPAMLRKKVYVIDEVHMLTTEAFNALLKTLEEPPPHVLFVMATTEPQKIPNTILSRCQRYDLKLIPSQRLAEHISSIFAREQLAIEPGAVNLIVRESGGSVRDALSLSDQIISYVGNGAITEAVAAEVLGVADRTLTRAFVTALLQRDAPQVLTLIDQALARGIDESQILRAITRAVRDLAVLKASPRAAASLELSPDEANDLAALAETTTASQLSWMFERLLACADDMPRTAQPRFVLEFALIDLATEPPLMPLATVVQQLRELEARVGGRGGAGPGGGGSSQGSGGTGTRTMATPTRGAAQGAGPGARTSAAVAGDGGAGAGMSGEGPALGDLARHAADRGRATAANSMQGAPGDAPASAGHAPATTGHAPASAGHAPASAGHVPATTGHAPASAGHAPASAGHVPLATGHGPAMPAVAVGANGVGASSPGAATSVAQSGGRAPAFATTATPAPPSAQAPRAANGSHAPAVLNGANHEHAWEQVLARLEERRRFALLGYYQHARVLSWQNGALVVGFAAEFSSLGEMAREKDKHEEMRGLLSELFGTPIQLTIRMLSAEESAQLPARSVLESKGERHREERAARELEAKQHPMTKLVLDSFGASIKEIITDV